MPKGIYLRTIYHRGRIPWNKNKKGIFHHSEEAKRKMSENHKGKKLLDITRKKMSESKMGERHPMYGKHLSIKTKEKLSQKLKGRKRSEEDKEKISKNNARFWAGKKFSKRHKEHLRKNHKGMTGKHHSQITREKMSNFKKDYFRQNPNLLQKAKRRMMIVRSLSEKRPTEPEKIIIDMHIQDIWYCGDGKFWIPINGRILNPDFKAHNQKKVIEVFGDYWHKGENLQDRIDLYNQIDFKCLVLWENELKRNREICKNRILNFINKENDEYGKLLEKR